MNNTIFLRKDTFVQTSVYLKFGDCGDGKRIVKNKISSHLVERSDEPEINLSEISTGALNKEGM